MKCPLRSLKQPFNLTATVDLDRVLSTLPVSYVIMLPETGHCHSQNFNFAVTRNCSGSAG